MKSAWWKKLLLTAFLMYILFYQLSLCKFDLANPTPKVFRATAGDLLLLKQTCKPPHCGATLSVIRIYLNKNAIPVSCATFNKTSDEAKHPVLLCTRESFQLKATAYNHIIKSTFTLF